MQAEKVLLKKTFNDRLKKLDKISIANNLSMEKMLIDMIDVKYKHLSKLTLK